jgi:hypothetical protein
LENVPRFVTVRESPPDFLLPGAPGHHRLLPLDLEDEWVPGSGNWVAPDWPLFSKVLFFLFSFSFEKRKCVFGSGDWVALDRPLFSKVLYIVSFIC